VEEKGESHLSNTAALVNQESRFSNQLSPFLPPLFVAYAQVEASSPQDASARQVNNTRIDRGLAFG